MVSVPVGVEPGLRGRTMNIGILTIGNELTSGRISDTNSALIARAVRAQGWSVAAMLSVGDDDGAIHDALDFLLARAEAVIATGGLGPTADDITTAAIARAFGLALRQDDAVLAHVRDALREAPPRLDGEQRQAGRFPGRGGGDREPHGDGGGVCRAARGKDRRGHPGGSRPRPAGCFRKG